MGLVNGELPPDPEELVDPEELLDPPDEEVDELPDEEPEELDPPGGVGGITLLVDG
ncbi:MAG: hypothetical protein MjAS7_2059 [Metallosphaera javensis (ex Sakai et al. 2022)]|nr:MAG: hypothetical protein MjAS7_2059 [Metallosphaera javensis (ex Sakai et al. 2022)]